MFAGGIADKLGNRYEAKWLVRQLLDVIGGKAGSLRFEGISASFKGFEFAVRKGDTTEWHQTKISNPNGNWTLAALKREGVLQAFKERLNESENHRCIFVSQDPAKDIGSLTKKAKIASTAKEYRDALGQGSAETFKELQSIWATDSEGAFSWLKRCEFRTESQSSIDSAISAYSDLYFFKLNGDAFAVLRDFLEIRINKDITTETARSELRSERKLTLKDWSLDPTLRERLSLETAGYLETYNPFGVDGSTIPRVETCKLVDLIGNAERPSVVLLTGVAGSGKSGVVREFIEQLADLGIPHLAFRIDHRLDCASPKALGKAITDRNESPVVTLKGLSPDQLSVLIVDQVDAVSEVSGRKGAVKRAILTLIDNARSVAGIVLIFACRTFDLESDQRLKALKETHGVEHIDVQLLTWESDVEPMLLSRSISVDQFTNQQKELLRLPLNLAIFLETFDGSKPMFASRNDLFARLLERKGRSIRNERNIAWDVISPLSELAAWMSEQQRLDAPDDILSAFGGALDILSSEGLIVRSRGNINFSHESFFDYIYARTFAARQQSLESLLMESEQHLFRRTQVRQILETLRQVDMIRYLRELRTVLDSENVRYHIKVAVTQWLGALSDPSKDERDIVFALDGATGPFPPLERYALLSSPGWFDRLFQDGWILANINGPNAERADSILMWLSSIAGQRPSEIAGLLDNWWQGDPDRGQQLLNWFGFVRRQKSDDALIDLCCRVIRSIPPGLFDIHQSNHRDMLFHTWAADNPLGAAKILKAYFDAWFEAHPGRQPFESHEFRDLDAHFISEMAKKAPEAFLDGAISAFVRSIENITSREDWVEREYSFRHRSYSGHRFGADLFLSIFRGALVKVAKERPEAARAYLAVIDPMKHEVFTHIWLETIASNGEKLADLFVPLLESPFLFEAGWDGADWKSFADAAKEVLPHVAVSEAKSIERKILSHEPELQYAKEIVLRIKLEGESEPWLNSKAALFYLSKSGREQRSILESIGFGSLSDALKERLVQLRRKFPGFEIPEPHDNEGGFVQSPIKRDQAEHMTDAQWLGAMERYDNDTDRRRGRSFIDGGARELARVLQHLAKEQPARFATLLHNIPNECASSICKSSSLGAEQKQAISMKTMLQGVILNAHGRQDRPYGSDIVQADLKAT